MNEPSPQIDALPVALVLGGSGLIGGLLLRRLLDSGKYQKVIAISRQRLPLAHSQLENIVDDMSNLAEVMRGLTATDVYCCLGTTMKVAGSEQKFRHVDYELPVIAAESARKSGATHFLVVSAIGANARSHFFYNRVKGELEAELKRLGFPYLTIMQPSLLLGDRDEQRVVEKVSGQIFGFLKPVMVGGLANIAPIDAENVANKMVEEAMRVRSGDRQKQKVVTIQSKDMQ
ncbi:MAG: NAD(P)H-binding protein [Hahellaceae bacterium]|nr:NAD(P)H-binding protein [Hahellaceae bacterium]MCP5212139.1 NAD(P)H-binding protein [Hahellaceae bacterium]